MRRAFVFAALVASAGALSFFISTATAHNTCSNNYNAALPAYSWLWTIYNYTNYSEYVGYQTPIYVNRMDSSGAETWSVNDTVMPAYVFFNNGGFSPWRKSGFFNNTGTAYESYLEQGNDNSPYNC